MAIAPWKPDRILARYRQWSGRRRARAIDAALRADLERAEQLEADWQLDSALAAWDALRTKQPSFTYGVAAYARTLGKLGRERDAIALLRAASEREPDLVFLLVDQVHLLCQIADFGEALRVAQIIAARFPGLPAGALLIGKSLRHMERFAEADTALADGRMQFPESPDLAVEHGAVADVRGDRAEALRRGLALVRDFPDFPLAHAFLGAALKKERQFDEADRVLRAAMAQFPDNSNLAANYAWVADSKGDLEEALRRWSGIVERFGHEPRVRAAYNETLSHAELARLDEAADHRLDPATAAAAPPAPAMGADATRHKPLFNRFQSLGRNCEFGFVQRHFGAEPMGLLRWAGIEHDKLLIGLASDFEGVGGADRTRLDCNEGNGEYFTTDTFYGLGMHTFVIRGSAADKDLFAKMCKRLSFLRMRLLDDLREGDKLFVFLAEGAAADEEARALHAAIRRHGPGRLLFVRVASPGEEPGTVRDLGDGLVLGFLDQHGLHGNHWAISFHCWLALCQRVDALFAPNPS